MRGSLTHPACKHVRGTTASEICVVRGDEGIALPERAHATTPPDGDRPGGIR